MFNEIGASLFRQGGVQPGARLSEVNILVLVRVATMTSMSQQTIAAFENMRFGDINRCRRALDSSAGG